MKDRPFSTVNTNSPGVTVWFTGLSGAGKTTISRVVEKELQALVNEKQAELERYKLTTLFHTKLHSTAFTSKYGELPQVTA